MKKLFLVLVAIALVASFANAQQFWGKGKMSWGGGAELSLPMGNLGDVSGFGFGPFGKFQYGMNDDILLMGSLGYTYWTKKNDLTSASAVTFLVGGKYNLSSQVGKGEIGLYFTSITESIPSVSYLGYTYGGGTATGSETNFVFAPGFGYEVGNLDFSVKFVLGTDATNLAARVAYQVPIQ